LYVNYSSYVSKYKNRLGGTQVMRASLLFALLGAILLGPGASAATAGGNTTTPQSPIAHAAGVKW
jgi:hypothetical protein